MQISLIIYVKILERELTKMIYDTPKSNGVAAVIERARQLHGLHWKPARSIVKNDKKYMQYDASGIDDTNEYDGGPYSSARVDGKFIGLDIKIETFLSAVINPFSVLYKKDLSDFFSDAYCPLIKNAYLYYGTVCSAYVNYSLGIDYHISTHEWWKSEEFTLLPDQTPDAIELCDTMVTTKSNGRSGGHVKIITAIGRDENGKVQEVEISEGVVPFTICKTYTPAQIQDMIDNENDRYRVYRYNYLDTVTCEYNINTDSNNQENRLMLCNGNMSNYRVGDIVQFTMSGEPEMLIVGNEEDKYNIEKSVMEDDQCNGNNYKKYCMKFLKTGSYKAFFIENGQKSNEVEFKVIKVPEQVLFFDDGTPVMRAPYRIRQNDGKSLTEESSCLYDENKKLKETTSVILTNEKEKHNINIGIYCKDNVKYIRTAVNMTNNIGITVKAVPISLLEETEYYIYECPENVNINIKFNESEECIPTHVSLKNEAMITYSQKKLTEEDVRNLCCTIKIEKYMSDFCHIYLTCCNEFGRETTKHLPILIK